MNDHSDVEWCLEHDEHLSAREAEFLESLLERDGDFSEAQDDWLAQIKARIESRLSPKDFFG
jgi:hypothetical protein